MEVGLLGDIIEDLDDGNVSALDLFCSLTRPFASRRVESDAEEKAKMLSNFRCP